jgi:hypothetical protein
MADTSIYNDRLTGSVIMPTYDEKFWRERRQPGVSEAEQRAANNALANNMIEGFESDEEFLALWDSHVRGEVSMEECLKIVIARAQRKDE